MSADKNTAAIGFEQKIWEAADTLRGNLNAAEYEGVVLGLIFLKYISDKFEIYLIIACFMTCWASAYAEQPPIMGWSSWNTYGFQINDSLVRTQADAMVNLGFYEKGYKYINIDESQSTRPRAQKSLSLTWLASVEWNDSRQKVNRLTRWHLFGQ